MSVNRLFASNSLRRSMTWRFVRAALLFAVLKASPAAAAYSISLTPVADPFASDTQFSVSWSSYVLSVSSDDGGRIGAVDVDLKGIFHQRWGWDEDAQSYSATPAGLATSGVDSHLMPLDGSLFAIAPTEDNNMDAPYAGLADLAGSIDYGVGTRMRGVWGVPGANVTSLDLGYVVIPRGYESQLEYAIDVANPFGDVFNFRQGASFPMPAPRPQPPPMPEPLLPPVNPSPPVVTLPSVAPPPQVPPVIAPPAGPLGTLPLQASATQILWSPDNGLPTGYTAYQMDLALPEGNLVGAVDVRINAPLFQQWTDLDDDGIADPSPRGLATSGADSHLLIPSNALHMPLYEDNDGLGLGLGSHLGGAWGVIGAEQTSAAQLAYLVVPENLSFHDLDISVDLVARDGDFFSPIIELASSNFDVLSTAGALLQAGVPVELLPYKTPPVVEPPPVPKPSPVVINDSPPIFDPPATIDPPPTVESPPTSESSPESPRIDLPIVTVIDDNPAWERPTGHPWIDLTYWQIDLTDQYYDSDNSYELLIGGHAYWLSYAAFDLNAVQTAVTASAPEPGSLVLAIVAAIGMTTSLRRRRKACE